MHAYCMPYGNCITTTGGPGPVMTGSHTYMSLTHRLIGPSQPPPKMSMHRLVPGYFSQV